MQFSAWHPLDDAGRVAPASPGVLQARADGLIAYPRGRSAMVFYDASRDAATLADHLAGEGRPGLARARALGASLVRFGATASTPSPTDALARLLATFRDRFGAPPLANQDDDTETPNATTTPQ